MLQEKENNIAELLAIAEREHIERILYLDKKDTDIKKRMKLLKKVLYTFGAIMVVFVAMCVLAFFNPSMRSIANFSQIVVNGLCVAGLIFLVRVSPPKSRSSKYLYIAAIGVNALVVLSDLVRYFQ